MNIFWLLLNGGPFFGRRWVMVDIVWLVVGDIFWLVVDIFWLLVGGGGWWWVVVSGGIAWTNPQ